MLSATTLWKVSPSAGPAAVRTAHSILQREKSLPSTDYDEPQVDEPAVLHRSLVERPHKVCNAAGSYLSLEDGRKVLDACGGAAVAIIGHGNKDVTAETVAQMDQVSYVHTGSYTTDSAEKLAQCLLDKQKCAFDHGLVKAFFVGSGSEANDAAMKYARQYWFEQGQDQRRFYVSRKQGYHGYTIGAMSISSNLSRKRPFQDTLLPHVSFVSAAYAYQYQREDETEEEYASRLVKEVEDHFLDLGPDNVISFRYAMEWLRTPDLKPRANIGASAETVVGATSGCVPAPKGYFRGVRAVCDRYGILLHLDEIMCGMGRTGSYYAFEEEGMRPDIVTLAKGLGGGYAPIAAMHLGRNVVDVLRAGTSAFNHGHTYQAHPVCCATSLAVQRIVEEQGLVSRCRIQGQKLGFLLRQAFADCKHVGDIRGTRLFWALEFVQDRSTKEPLQPSLGFAAGVARMSFKLGVAIYPGAGTVDGLRGDHVLLAPPYNVSDEELEVIVRTLKAACDAQECIIQ